VLARVLPPRTLGVMLLLALGACGSGEEFGGAATGAFCADAGQLACCVGGCDGDTVATPVCDASGWQCPGGSVSSAECPGSRFCLGPACAIPPGFGCCEDGCDGDRVARPVCIDTGWACPRGSVSSDRCPGRRFCQGPLGAPALRAPAGAMDGPSGPE
jgi:hypothetical protein